MTKPKPDDVPILAPIVGLNLRRLRHESEDLTQDALAARSTITQGTISKIERGQATSFLVLEKLAGAMGRHPTEFFKLPRRKP